MKAVTGGGLDQGEAVGTDRLQKRKCRFPLLALFGGGCCRGRLSQKGREGVRNEDSVS